MTLNGICRFYFCDAIRKGVHPFIFSHPRSLFYIVRTGRVSEHLLFDDAGQHYVRIAMVEYHFHDEQNFLFSVGDAMSRFLQFQFHFIVCCRSTVCTLSAVFSRTREITYRSVYGALLRGERTNKHEMAFVSTEPLSAHQSRPK